MNLCSRPQSWSMAITYVAAARRQSWQETGVVLPELSEHSFQVLSLGGSLLLMAHPWSQALAVRHRQAWAPPARRSAAGPETPLQGPHPVHSQAHAWRPLPAATAVDLRPCKVPNGPVQVSNSTGLRGATIEFAN